MHRLPNEILFLIYKFSEPCTRLNLNKAFKWSYRAANPFMEKQFILPRLPSVKRFNYIIRGH